MKETTGAVGNERLFLCGPQILRETGGPKQPLFSGTYPRTRMPARPSSRKELHGPTGMNRRVWAKRVANVRAASRSSHSRSS